MSPFSLLDTPTRRIFKKADVTALESTRSRLVDSNIKSGCWPPWLICTERFHRVRPIYERIANKDLR